MDLLRWLFTFFGLGTSPEALTKKAASLAAKGNVAAAIEAQKQALSQDPLYIPAYDGLGKMYFRMGFRDEAEREFAIADGLETLDKNPDDLEAGLKLGRAMMSKDLTDLAVKYLDPLIQKHPRHPELLKLSASCYKNLENFQRARELFRTGLEVRPNDADFYLQLGALELKAGNQKEGERLTNTARLLARAASDPNDAASRRQLGELFHSQNKLKEAAEFLREATGINPQDPETWVLLGQTYWQLGLKPAAVDALNQAARLAPDDPRPQKALGDVLHQMGRFAEGRAAKELAGIIEGGTGDPQDPQQGARFLKYLLSIGKTDEAKSKLPDFLAKWPDNRDLRLIQGRLLFKAKKFEEAVDILRPLAREKESWAEPHIWLALVYQRLGDHMGALAEGQLAARLAPKSPAIHKILGDIYREQKKFGMAENAYETAEHLRSIKNKK